MAFRPTVAEVRARFQTALADGSVADVIESNAIQVDPYTVPDARKKQAVILLSILDVQFDGLRRSSTGDFQSEKQYSAERQAILEELQMIEGNMLTGPTLPVLPTVLTWYSATGVDNAFTAADFTGGSTGTGNSVTFQSVSGADVYFAIAVSEELSIISPGGGLNQIGVFQEGSRIEINDIEYRVYVSDTALFAINSDSTWAIG